MSDLSIVNGIWKALKHDIVAGDLNGAAETLVTFLIDEDYSPNDIKQAFRSDSDIKKALRYFLESPSDGLYHEDKINTASDAWHDDIEDYLPEEDYDEYDEDE